jgi:hypothetical protein
LLRCGTEERIRHQVRPSQQAKQQLPEAEASGTSMFDEV